MNCPLLIPVSPVPPRKTESVDDDPQTPLLIIAKPVTPEESQPVPPLLIGNVVEEPIELPPVQIAISPLFGVPLMPIAPAPVQLEIQLPPKHNPLNAPLPLTDSFCDGEVEPMPMRPLADIYNVEVAARWLLALA